MKLQLNGPELLDRALQDRDSGSVRRWHATRTNRVQSVAEHTHGCCMLLMLVAPDSRVQLYQALLTHDHAERATGDVPATAKTMWPHLANALQQAELEWHHKHKLLFSLTEDEQCLLNFCDYMELLLWSYEELCMGNLYAIEPITGIIGVLDKMYDQLHQICPPAAYLHREAANLAANRIDRVSGSFKIQPR